ncbi:MAG: o-succinylbenzoate synthase [Acidobacteriaceae bacterium]|nr:o-succinylbenzoate synthase [Acidobacteriaceae bacterium]
MRIQSVTLTHVRVPLVEPFRISSGAISEKDAILVALRSDGLTGYGESSPMPGQFYSTDTPEGSWRELCETVVPAVIGRELNGPAEWNRLLDNLGCGRFATTGVETALWDIAAQREGKPLYQLLGGKRGAVQSGLAVGLYDNIADMLRTAERHLATGRYRRLKLKIEPGRDIEIVRAARQEFGDIPMYVDANGAYALEQSEIFERLDEFGLMMFEQPLPGPALQDLATLRTRVRTPICLDESLETVPLLQRAVELGSLDIANFKIQRIGGFHHALEMLEICRRHAIGAWVGTMPELGIGQAQGAALATLEGFNFPTDVEASLRWFRSDIIAPLIEVYNGCINMRDEPGLGYGIDQANVERYRIAEQAFS